MKKLNVIIFKITFSKNLECICKKGLRYMPEIRYISIG